MDNPFVGKTGVLPEIYTYGHRNAQGMAVHPVTGEVWQNEHGPQGGDELNFIRPSLNYGWPMVGFGVNYTTGRVIHEGTIKEGMEGRDTSGCRRSASRACCSTRATASPAGRTT